MPDAALLHRGVAEFEAAACEFATTAARVSAAGVAGVAAGRHLTSVRPRGAGRSLFVRNSAG